MPQKCRDSASLAGVVLYGNADPCPWKRSSSPRDCHHHTSLDNGRPSKLYNVEIASKPLNGLVSISSKDVAILRYPVIMPNSRVPKPGNLIAAARHKHKLEAPSTSSGQPEEVQTTVDYVEGVPKSMQEKIETSYWLDIP